MGFKMKIKNRILAMILLLITTVAISGCYHRGIEDESVFKVSPFRVEQSAFLQLYIPNKSQSCLIRELVGVSEIDESREIEEALRLLKKRSTESVNFVNMNSLVFLNITVLTDTVYIEYEFLPETQLTEMEEALMLYAIINTATTHPEIDFVKLNNNHGYTVFFNYYNIEVPLASTPTLLYKDYISPYRSLEGWLEAMMEKREFPFVDELVVSAFHRIKTTPLSNYALESVEYNKYGEYVTMRVKMGLYDDEENRRDVHWSFLLELTGNRFFIKELLDHSGE